MSAYPEVLSEDVEDRIDTEVSLALGKAGYLDASGETDTGVMADKIAKHLVSAAVVEAKNERGAKCITRRALMQHMFSGVAGPEDWSEQDDPEVAEGVYGKLDS